MPVSWEEGDPPSEISPWQPKGATTRRLKSRRLQTPGLGDAHNWKVNFVACQLFAFGVAIWFRTYLNAGHAHATVRHAFATIIGIYLAVFCFGWYSFITALSYLTLCQVNRVYIFNYGILATDFSGPLMIVTQKITTLAFQLHDELISCFFRKRPTLLEYLSYHLNFMSILAGPCSSFQDYISFIEGRHIQSKLKDVNLKEKGYVQDPSPNKAVLHKMCICLVSLVVFLTISKAFPVAYIVDDTFIKESSFLTRLGYLYIATMASKPKYYFAWTLADAVNNAAGYGFSGVDEKGNFRWDLINNLNIWNIETATSFKMYIDNWNIQTAAWLKRVCYDRAPKYRTALTFLLSALWHGVYPGYYFTFITAIPVMLASRAVRNNFRQYFMTSKMHKFGYDILTWIVTQLAISYTCAPFFLLAVEPTIKLYKYVFKFMLCKTMKRTTKRCSGRGAVGKMDESGCSIHNRLWRRESG
uniref:Lysophospholipid acyltransferase 1 n=1 Tax=Pyxicephalus adspersus TaxID=30357 RepID=A0AAV3AP68_PYXAD|nr:TPA: hypothetical protein GDO54_012158 [Pyxicephalus adspersus]